MSVRSAEVDGLERGQSASLRLWRQRVHFTDLMPRMMGFDERPEVTALLIYFTLFGSIRMWRCARGLVSGRSWQSVRYFRRTGECFALGTDGVVCSVPGFVVLDCVASWPQEFTFVTFDVFA